MNNILSFYDQINIIDQRMIDGKLGMADDKYIYFIMTVDDEEVIHMEQATLARFLVEQGFQQVASPVVNQFGQWVTEYQGEHYIVYKYASSPQRMTASHGQMIAHFHQLNQAYPYEPNYISSYGQWKSLWIEKLTSFEQEMITKQRQYPALVFDMLPYVIGMSENAIQYIDESMRQANFDQRDQGTITFQRYHDQLLKPIIWPDQIMYDHPMRDLAELMRRLLWHDEQGVNQCHTLLRDYTIVSPLSELSWRLLYARLIFPIHFFDVFGDIMQQSEQDMMMDQLAILIQKQPIYEQRLTELFKQFKFRDDETVLPMIEWI